LSHSRRTTDAGTSNLFARGEFNDRRRVEDPAGKVLDQDLVSRFGEFICLGESLLCGGNDDPDSTVAAFRINLISNATHRASLTKISNVPTDPRLVQTSHSPHLPNGTSARRWSVKDHWIHRLAGRCTIEKARRKMLMRAWVAIIAKRPGRSKPVLSGISRGLPFRTSAAPLAATDPEMLSTPSPRMLGTELWRRYIWTNQPSLKQIDFPSTVHLASDEAGTPI
jgi:hypothetical protein